MPTILDATVVASAYDTSGNGGRKLVRLDNGTLASVLKNGTADFRVYKSVDNGITWTLIKTVTAPTIQDVSLVTNGIYIYALYAQSNAIVTLRMLREDGTEIGLGYVHVEPSQTTLGSVSVAINEAKTELHATWSSKNATYPNSFNIRYAKGTIATDGSVAWGAVSQLTTLNSTSYPGFINPSIIIKGYGLPVILCHEDRGATAQTIYALTYNGSSFSQNIIFQDATTSYRQASPSAIFVPQSVNGLANGRIWVAWYGMDSIDTTRENIRVSYSDDGGVSWSAMQKLTTGNTYYNTFPTITANKKNEISLLWQYGGNGLSYVIKKIKNIANAWGTATDAAGSLSVNNAQSPSTLFDLSVNFTEPLFIYKDIIGNKVNFSGTWTVTTISVTQGSIGTKTSPSPLLTYAITTDGTMSTITEKVNGVTIGTKTATSGQSQIAGLTQAQWDAVRFGKYKDITAGLNTLTIEMGTEVFTYTFDKRPASDADMLSVTKAVQDSANVYLPAVKSKLGTAIRAKGGMVNDTDSLEVMAGAVGGIPLGKKFATGTITNNIADGTVTVTGLSFKPSIISVYANSSAMGYGALEEPTFGLTRETTTAYVRTLDMNESGFSIRLNTVTTSKNYTWKAWE